MLTLRAEPMDEGALVYGSQPSSKPKTGKAAEQAKPVVPEWATLPAPPKPGRRGR